MKKLYLVIFACIFCLSALLSQELSNEDIKARIDKYKSDIRGPYKEIRWYCPDGSIIPPKERCPEPGGVQRARHKDEVIKLAETNHVFLGQILATTPNEDFWDIKENNSRLKQYQLEKYLRTVDNGWILRKAQFYRGAFQAEDEELWGLQFYDWLLTDDKTIESHFFLIRESIKDIPHHGDDNLKQNIRLTSKEISDEYAPFLDIRVKIHGQPDAMDIDKVKEFKEKHATKMPSELLDKMDILLQDMEKQYQPFDIRSISKYMSFIPKDKEIYTELNTFQKSYKSTSSDKLKVELLANILLNIRTGIVSVTSAKSRLALFDISVILEDVLFKEMAKYTPQTLGEQINTIYNMGVAVTGCGYLETWEWDKLKSRISVKEVSSLSQTEMVQLFESCRNITEWGTGMVVAVYEDVVNKFAAFEPMTNGFIDEKVRSSLLLRVGLSINSLAENISGYLPVTNQIMNLKEVTSARGLNPGYAKGELVVITGSAENINFSKDKIYVFNKPPSDLKPVAGIATVIEGNPVSHIQLLARNLGIPNAVITLNILDELKQFSGRTVFYAVSSKGIIVMKPEEEMNSEEIALFVKKKREETKISVPINKIDLSVNKVLDMRTVNATSSGKICGPKAANLGQLKLLFPDNVVEGLVIPFGIFREHLNQTMPGKDISYWDYLNKMYEQSANLKETGTSESEIEEFMLGELSIIHKAIKQISFSDAFVADLRRMFLSTFNKHLGSIPVFLRSDTNMEDLKEFTGAGLNLTLFNVVKEDVILQGIRDVWASPYTERSYKWRQRYLNNPENVFPSILVIPSVNVDYSGVVVTKGVGQGAENDITIAFSLGAGGAVDGQAAESYLLKENGKNVLLSPAREPAYNKLPSGGGTSSYFASFEKPVLNEDNLLEIRKLVANVRQKLPNSPGVETSGPFDIEMGFKDNKLWLFQVRPFVENKNAASQLYLESLNPVLDANTLINLNENIKR